MAPPADWGRRPVVDVRAAPTCIGSILATELQRYGYVIVDVGRQPLARLESRMLMLARSLGLGAPFVPRLYAGRGLYRDSGLHLIGTALGSVGHAAFVSSEAQALHCDGTLEPLGLVNTTMLGCVEKAEEGGASVLFNALGGFCDLWAKDRSAAQTLLWAKCLARSAGLDPAAPPATGPAFGLRKQYLLTRYSRTPGDRYYAPLGADCDLTRALAHLSALARRDSSYYFETTLSPGQILIFANSRLSHGRTAYRTGPAGHSRTFLRALFTTPPRFWLD